MKRFLKKWDAHLALVFSRWRQRQLYQKLARQHLGAPAATHWTSAESQRCRHQVFLRFGKDSLGASWLDVGCGQGELLDLLLQSGFEGRFTGYEIVPEFVEYCKTRFPEHVFLLKDISKDEQNEIQQSFDYVVASGVFAFGNRAFFKIMVKRCFALCDKAFAFNIHTARSDAFFKISKEQARDFCKTLKPRAIEIHDDYDDRDFTLILWR